MNRKKNLIFISSPFLLVGIIFIIFGIVTMNQVNDLKRRCTEETIGTVVEVICESDYSSTEDSYTYTYYPVIEYQVGERTISQKSRSGQYPPKYKVGEQVEIYYNPDNAEEYIIKGDSTPHSLGLVFVVIGSIATVVWLICSIKSAWRT